MTSVEAFSREDLITLLAKVQAAGLTDNLVSKINVDTKAITDNKSDHYVLDTREFNVTFVEPAAGELSYFDTHDAKKALVAKPKDYGFESSADPTINKVCDIFAEAQEQVRNDVKIGTDTGKRFSSATYRIREQLKAAAPTFYFINSNAESRIYNNDDDDDDDDNNNDDDDDAYSDNDEY